MTERRFPAATLAALAIAGMAQFVTAQSRPAPATRRVTVSPDGSFSPAVVRIRPGDTVEWTLPSPTNAIVPTSDAPTSAAGASCPAPCARGRSGGPVDGQYLCGTGAPLATMDETWADPNNTGVFIRLLWNRLQVAPGTDDASFDFRDLDREISQPVRYGKLYSLAIKAGSDGAPDWIFSTDASAAAGRGRGTGAAHGDVTPLLLQDTGGGGRDSRGCGMRMTLGSPTDPEFEAWAIRFPGSIDTRSRRVATSLYYFDPSACRTGPAPIGTIAIER